jgi:hypothetical protein
VSLTLRTGAEVTTLRQSIELLSVKIGPVLLVLGGIAVVSMPMLGPARKAILKLMKHEAPGTAR